MLLWVLRLLLLLPLEARADTDASANRLGATVLRRHPAAATLRQPPARRAPRLARAAAHVAEEKLVSLSAI